MEKKLYKLKLLFLLKERGSTTSACLGGMGGLSQNADTLKESDGRVETMRKNCCNTFNYKKTNEFLHEYSYKAQNCIPYNDKKKAYFYNFKHVV